ncbi:structural maintenance of chromosomes protein 1 [Trematosphaeria pertusa]|uniref:Structural maintenance of chromosomes protein n=1 Tax=Trematosphaeria pertusa TaxID=390896 RepID=A0A6A6IXS7_9PLEO|nr:structural maintenance of chromosomes protein 1 [Trematosphaeria pertusa]KAF2254827.1 structural maintenance of chromosomes protein 1 [Trematosphaeria pertusa]
MGKLVRLELYNFKTYRGKHILPFGDSYFTSIIGPNGSGKSNSMDAISFVLGIKSASLRSRELRELVYRGRIIQTSKTAVDEANGDADGAQNGHADGETQEDGDTQKAADPKTAWVEAVFEDDTEQLHRWRRTITTAGQSEYRINGRVVTAKAYNEALEEHSILVKARAFLIPQGEVEEVAKKPPRDITHMIEQISGSLDYKADYERLKTESDAAQENNSQFLVSKRQINAEIKTYSDQKAEAEEYERKVAERDEATVTHIMWKLYYYQQAMQKARDKIASHQEELKEHKRGVEKYQQKLQEATQAEAKVKREITKTNNSINAKHKETEQTQNNLVPIEEKIRLTTQDMRKLQDRIASLTDERDKQIRDVADFDKRLAEVQKAQDKWDAEFKAAAQQQGRELSQQDLEEYNRLRQNVAKQSHANQIEIDRLKREVGTEKEHARNLEQKVKSFEATVERLNEEITRLQETQRDRKTRLKELQKTRTSKNQDLNKLRSDRTRLQSQYTELNQLLQEHGNKLYTAQMGRRESRQQEQARELVSQLKRIFGSSIYGRYKDLIKPKQRKYNMAVGRLLGWYMDAVIVDTDKTAKDCIQYLKEQKICQMSFIPLDTATIKGINQNLKGAHEGMRLGIDCIDYPSHLERAIASACGDSIICDNLKVARYLCFEKRLGVKAVTLDGSVISKGNNMTGGRLQQDDKEENQRWSDQEIDTLTQKVEGYRSQLAALPKLDQRHTEEDNLQVELNDLDNQISRIQDELRTLDRNLDSQKKELRHDEGILRQEHPKYEDALQRLRNKEEELKGYQDSVDRVTDQVFAAFCQRLGYASIRDYEAQQGTAQQAAAEKKLEFSKQRSTLQNMRSHVQSRLDAVNDRLKSTEAKLQRDKAALEENEAKRDELQNSIDVLQAELETLQEKLMELEEKKTERVTVVKEQRRKLDQRNEKVKKVLKEVEDQEQAIKSKGGERYNLLKKCRLDEIKLPLTPDSAPLSSLPMSDAARQDADAMDIDEEPDTTHIEQPEVEDYGIEVDFDELDEDLRVELDDILEQEDSEDDKVRTQATTAQKDAESKLTDAIAALDAEISKSTPNMRASDRLDRAREKLRDAETEFTQARNRAIAAKTAFEKVKQKRLDLFMKAYDHIHDNILPVYQKLTRSQQFPLGGTAYLDLENSDEPYLEGVKYHAMPPLKRFRDMEHLSGGEKTIAALALIFAIHSYQPSPFFVLDEVDAALDNVNVARVADYITKNAGPGTQFIVITHKAGLYQESETLVGIMRDQSKMTSKAISLDLRGYQPVAQAA